MKIASSKYAPNTRILCFDILSDFVQSSHAFCEQHAESFLSLCSKLSKSLTVRSLSGHSWLGQRNQQHHCICIECLVTEATIRNIFSIREHSVLALNHA